ncbi:hypothetical protein D6D25_04111 [Aureobasidium pullulans]|nr:hypothetical protein D6D25_04111 [Aureobasidium pullulans]
MVVLVDEEGSQSKRRFRPAPPVSQIIGGKEYDPRAMKEKEEKERARLEMIVDGESQRPESSLSGKPPMLRENKTYGPRILRQRAAAKRKETGNDKWWSQHDDSSSFAQVLKTNITRPIVMLVTEPICIFCDVYVALVYGVLYLCFVAYPLAFQQERGWSSGMTGLAYCGIGVGASDANEL